MTHPLHIGYIGRLEYEKGIDIVIEAIQCTRDRKDIIWHICGDGLYSEQVRPLAGDRVYVYGNVPHNQVGDILKVLDILVMPSRFLETFGLVALEALEHGVPVVGFRQGGLIDFIPPSLSLDPNDPLLSLLSILDTQEFEVLDISDFSYSLWIRKLDSLTKGSNKVLIVHDYLEKIGGAEQYIYFLKESLENLGKGVQIFGYKGKLSKWKRIFLMILAPLSFWRYFSLRREIRHFNPDVIWMQGILRYVGPWGLLALARANGRLMLTHHDLGLISPRPSHIYSEKDIPTSPSLMSWVHTSSISSFIGTYFKWLYVTWIWYFLKRVKHIVPSRWMVANLRPYTQNFIECFPHTVKNNKVK